MQSPTCSTHSTQVDPWELMVASRLFVRFSRGNHQYLLGSSPGEFCLSVTPPPSQHYMFLTKQYSEDATCNGKLFALQAMVLDKQPSNTVYSPFQLSTTTSFDLIYQHFRSAHIKGSFLRLDTFSGWAAGYSRRFSPTAAYNRHLYRRAPIAVIYFFTHTLSVRRRSYLFSTLPQLVLGLPCLSREDGCPYVLMASDAAETERPLRIFPTVSHQMDMRAQLFQVINISVADTHHAGQQTPSST